VLCITTLSRGEVVVSTGVGAASTDFDASLLLQPPILASVTPSSWSTTGSTSIVIVGERCVGAWALVPAPGLCVPPLGQGCPVVTWSPMRGAHRFGLVPAANASGVVALPMQLASGAAPSAADGAGCFDTTALACVLADATAASYSSTRIVCTVPQGVGRDFKVRRACAACCVCVPCLCSLDSGAARGDDVLFGML
jgi:hypothetical protein